MKALARAAGCSAHLRRFGTAAEQYHAAARLAQALNDVEAAQALVQDAEHVRSLNPGPAPAGGTRPKAAMQACDQSCNMSEHESGMSDVE